jgi:VanZ family protein
MLTKKLLVLRKFALPLAVIYSITLSILSLISVKGLPSFGTDYDDKFYHVLAYFVLTMIWYLAIGLNQNIKKIIYIALGCIVYGIVIEAIQGKLTLHRVWDLLDIVANLIGVIFATLYIFRREKLLS